MKNTVHHPVCMIITVSRFVIITSHHLSHCLAIQKPGWIRCLDATSLVSTNKNISVENIT